MFVNDLRRLLRHFNHLLYADDLQIYIQFSFHNKRAIAIIGEDIVAIERWVALNDLRLNAKKPKAMLLGSARYVNAISTANIALYLHNAQVKFTDTVCNLGLNITSNLNWTDQVRSI